MTAKKFARAVAAEKDALLKEYFAPRSTSAVAERIRALKLTPSQRRRLRGAIDGALTDLSYTLLVALDGEARLGTLPQQEFGLFDEGGRRLTGGELEAAAWEVFHGE